MAFQRDRPFLTSHERLSGGAGWGTARFFSRDQSLCSVCSRPLPAVSLLSAFSLCSARQARRPKGARWALSSPVHRLQALRLCKPHSCSLWFTRDQLVGQAANRVSAPLRSSTLILTTSSQGSAFMFLLSVALLLEQVKFFSAWATGT